MNKERLVKLVNKAKKEYANDVTDHTETEYIVECLLNEGMIFPPCNIGDRVYMVIHDKRTKKPIECHVIGFWYTNHEDCCTIHLSRYIDGKLHSTFSVRFTDIGKTVFLTREEAQRELERWSKEQ